MKERTPIEKAATWSLVLQDPATSAEKFMEWQYWLSESPANRKAFIAIEETLSRLNRIDIKPAFPKIHEMALDDYDGSETVQQYLRRIRRSSAAASTNTPHSERSERDLFPIRRKVLGGCAIAAGLAGVILLISWLNHDSRHNTLYGQFAYATAPGQRTSITLADGSKITLDADSALNVNLTSDERSLRLGRGEAYFQVAKDSSRPFTVAAGGAYVRAIGTEFNVRMGSSRTVIAVTEGVVKVGGPSTFPKNAYEQSLPTSKDASIEGDRPNVSRHRVAEVVAGQAMAFAADGDLHPLPDTEARLAATWLTGRRQYLNEPLKYVLADVDRYTGRRIEVADDATGALQFTGTLSLDNSDAWLRALAIALPVIITQKPDGTLLVSRRPSRGLQAEAVRHDSNSGSRIATRNSGTHGAAR